MACIPVQCLWGFFFRDDGLFQWGGTSEKLSWNWNLLPRCPHLTRRLGHTRKPLCCVNLFHAFLKLGKKLRLVRDDLNSHLLWDTFLKVHQFPFHFSLPLSWRITMNQMAFKVSCVHAFGAGFFYSQGVWAFWKVKFRAKADISKDKGEEEALIERTEECTHAHAQKSCPALGRWKEGGKEGYRVKKSRLRMSRSKRYGWT